MGKRKALKIISIIILLCALVFVAYEVLQVRKVYVEGCETITEDKVFSLSGLKLDESIILVDTQKVMDAISADPYIKPVSVTIKYPDTINITIEERKEAVYVRNADLILILDKEGYLLKIVSQTESLPGIEVTGLPTDGFTIGKRVGSSDIFKVDELSKLLEMAEYSGIALTSVDLSLATDVIVKIEDGYTVEIGDDNNLEEKFNLVKSSVKELEEMGKIGGIIDVASAKNVYYREK